MRLYRIQLFFKGKEIKNFPVLAIKPGEALDKVIENNDFKFTDIAYIKIKVGNKIT